MAAKCAAKCAPRQVLNAHMAAVHLRNTFCMCGSQSTLKRVPAVDPEDPAGRFGRVDRGRVLISRIHIPRGARNSPPVRSVDRIRRSLAVSKPFQHRLDHSGDSPMHGADLWPLRPLRVPFSITSQVLGVISPGLVILIGGALPTRLPFCQIAGTIYFAPASLTPSCHERDVATGSSNDQHPGRCSGHAH